MMRAHIQKVGRKLSDLFRFRSLGPSITAALCVFTIGIAGFYTTVLYLGFEYVEHTLVGELMYDSLRAKTKAIEAGNLPKINDGVLLYGTHPKLPPIPEEFRHLPEGFTEIDTRPAYFVYRLESKGVTYVLAKNQDNFEDKEEVISVVILLIALAVGLTGILVGRLFYRRIMNPIRALAGRVDAAGRASSYTPLRLPARGDEIGDLARCCDDALSRLYDSLQREKTFTSTISHELRAPVNVISGALELLMMGHPDDRQRRQLERALLSCSDMKMMLTDFLQFARGGAGIAAPDTVDRILVRLAELWKPEAVKRGLTIGVVKRGTCPGTYSPVLLGSVLNNLCRNAIHYTREGRVELIETDEGVIVCDTGGGIAPEDVARMFEPGFRGAAGESAPGYGLGLPIVARICTRCGWRIHYAPLDNGSSFHLVLTQTAEH